MMPDYNPQQGLILAFVIIIVVYVFSTLWVGVHLLSDPTRPTVAAPKPPTEKSQITYKCKNGYLYFVVNGAETRASSDVPNICAQELNNASNSSTSKPSH